MKVDMELNVSDKEFYDLMMKSLKEEVKNVTKKDLELKEGLKYNVSTHLMTHSISRHN